VGISPLAKIYDGATVESGATLGDFVAVHPGGVVLSGATIEGGTHIWPGITIERGARLGPGVQFERADPSSVSASANVTVGTGCNVGAGAVIHSGVQVGVGAMVSPAAVVAQNVPPYAIVSGSPARVTGYVQNSVSAIPAREWSPSIDFPEKEDSVRIGVGNVTLHRLRMVRDPRGDLSAGEFQKSIPFLPKRYFLVFNVPSEKARGEHAHIQCHQFLICVKGSCSVVVDDGLRRCEVSLTSPDMGIHLPPLTWATQYKYSSDAVLLVFASDYYAADDYIRDYGDFVARVSPAAKSA